MRYEIPVWCTMPLAEHLCLGGCWGISSGELDRLVVDIHDPTLKWEKQGKRYCKNCEFNEDNKL